MFRRIHIKRGLRVFYPHNTPLFGRWPKKSIYIIQAVASRMLFYLGIYTGRHKNLRDDLKVHRPDYERQTVYG